jgi:NTP pyrophosphatase (non-canonical NTP hydrolase)
LLSDKTTSLLDLKLMVERFVHDRDWESAHSPKNLSMAIATEAAELMEIFRWMTEAESVDELDLLERGELGNSAIEELADIMIFCLAFANRTGVDVTLAIASKMEKNAEKYPVEECRGRDTWRK